MCMHLELQFLCIEAAVLVEIERNHLAVRKNSREEGWVGHEKHHLRGRTSALALTRCYLLGLGPKPYQF